jgi:hypothetical protein
MRILLKMLLVALGHIGVLFILYGTRVMRFLPIPDLLQDFIWFGLPAVIAFVLYYQFLSRSTFLKGPMRRTKLMACSVAALLVSLYCGMFLCLNTFGG